MNEIKIINGGVTAAQGFRAAGIHCGIKEKMPDSLSLDSCLTGKGDLAMILSDAPCAAAGTFTRNIVQAAPVQLTRKRLENGSCRGIIVNSGNANACAPHGQENAEKMCELAAAAVGLLPEDFAAASTGVIGQTLPIEAIEQGMPFLVQTLSETGSDAAADAIMTTDTVSKTCAVEFELDGRITRLGGIAKGSGMIHPNMGTLLCFLTTDAAIAPAVLQTALQNVIERTLNRVTIDGDTSTNDTCILLANGQAGNRLITEQDADYDMFVSALYRVLETLAVKIAADGEGASRLLTCTVNGAPDENSAVQLARSVILSPLLKAAMFGADANWGRVLCALGNSGIRFQPEKVDVSFSSSAGQITVCRGGQPVDFDEEHATEILSQDAITILVQLQEGTGKATCWGCDLTCDYVRINSDYRS